MFRLRSFDQTANTDQNYRTHKRHDDGTDQPAARPYPKRPKQPSTHNASEESENEVDENPVASALHYLAGQPACD